MYTSPLNKVTDRKKIVDFMKRFSFATLVTAKDELPIATHLPFVIKEEDDKLLLLSHVAKQNEQWQQMEDRPVMVIFAEPHAYISPTLYEKELNVPTWNYIAVHAYGKAQLITMPACVANVLEQTIKTYEPSYMEQWDRLPDKYRVGQMAGIVAFQIEVTELQAKEKLSQNKTPHEQEKISNALAASSDTNVQIISDYMRRNLIQG